jgi:hypothetical protein
MRPPGASLAGREGFERLELSRARPAPCGRCWAAESGGSPLLGLWVQPIRLLFLLVKVQPRQLASRPGSIFDCRGGDESVASSNVNALGRCDSGAERPGGQANWRAAKRNANLLETSTHEKPFVDRYGWKPSLPEWAEAVEHQGRTGQVHLMTRREGGRGTSGKKSRLKVGTVPVTSRGWRKRQGHLL